MDRKEEIICIGAASNEHYFPGLIAMVTSVLLNTERDLKINFNIIDGGITPNSWDLLVSTSLKINSNAQLVRHVVDLSSFDSFPRDFGGSVLTYARLLFPSLLKEDQMLYLDSDVLIFKDIREMWLFDLDESIIAACKDPLMDTIDQDCTVYADYGVDPKGIHFNAGILKINLAKWRNELITEKAINYILKHPTECKFWDQSALNIILFGKVKFMHSSNNFFAEYFNIENRGDVKYNIHFLMAKKPWLYHHIGTSYQLFYELMKVLNIQMNNSVYLNSLKSNTYKNKYLALYVTYLQVKVELFKYIGMIKKHRISNKSLQYWRGKAVEENDGFIKKQNLLYLENWKINLQILK